MIDPTRLIEFTVNKVFEIKDKKDKENYCRNIVYSEISFNRNLLSILQNNKEGITDDVKIKVLKRLKTEAYEAVMATGMPLDSIFSTNFYDKISRIEPLVNKSRYSEDLIKNKYNVDEEYQLEYNLVGIITEKVYVLKVIGEEDILSAVREVARINNAVYIMNFVMDLKRGVFNK